jgi:hypothetical protein
VPPQIRHIAALWSLTGYPSPKRPWPLERQIRAVREAGFDGFATATSPEHRRLAEKHGLSVIGYICSAQAADFPKLLRAQKEGGARWINVQMGRHDTTTAAALKMALALFKAAEKLGVEPSIETHRDTCTETPEKLFALAEAFEKETGRLLPVTWDFSHPAVIKHLTPAHYSARLLTSPALVQRAGQLHCRPFNGHHAQVPVTDGRGRLTPEAKDYLVFLEDVFRLWLKGNKTDRELFVVPEMGPVPGGYNVSTWPAAWEDAVRLQKLLDRIWKKVLQARSA